MNERDMQLLEAIQGYAVSMEIPFYLRPTQDISDSLECVDLCNELAAAGIVFDVERRQLPRSPLTTTAVVRFQWNFADIKQATELHAIDEGDFEND